ncbi:MAG: 50S ribosomal protein L24 [Candidatus Omnitrophica bacterium]|nr:50S ribosomal protein L24 [Candidatus Omnitrophota bacterium]
MRIKKNDTVTALTGRDRGKSGKILKVFYQKSRAIVEGINMVKKHTRKRKQEDQGGIIQTESPIDISNLALLCKSCNKPARIGVTVLSDGTKSRFCKKCKEMI